MRSLSLQRVLIFALAACVTSQANWQAHLVPPEVFDVLSYGAKGDGVTLDWDAMRHALLAMPGSGGRRPPNIWLIAGGRDKGGQFHDAGPLLLRRVKGAVLLGEARKVLRAAWALFTPCHLACSMVEALELARRNAVSGDVVLLSPACASFDMFADYEQRGEQFRQAVRTMVTGHSPAVDNAIHTG